MKSTVKGQLFNAGLLVFANHLGKWESQRNASFFHLSYAAVYRSRMDVLVVYFCLYRVRVFVRLWVCVCVRGAREGAKWV